MTPKYCHCGHRANFLVVPNDQLNRVQVKCPNCLLHGEARYTLDEASQSWNMLMQALKHTKELR